MELMNILSLYLSSIQNQLDDLLALDELTEQRVERICLALEDHMRLEEEYFYPYLEEYANTRDTVDTLWQEHAMMGVLVKELREEAPMGGHQVLKWLRDLYCRHVDLQVRRLHPLAAQNLTPERLNEITNKVRRFIQTKRLESAWAC